MEQLIFVAVIIFFSVVESIARARKAKQGGMEGLPERPPEGWEAARTEQWEEPETYDDDLPYDVQPSYDDTVQEREHTQESEALRSRPSSQTMLPRDLLEELAGLLEVPTARTIKLPTQSPQLPREETRLEPSRVSARGSRSVVGPPAEHFIHKSHAGYGTDPSSRAPSEQDGLDPLREGLSGDAVRVRHQLLSGGKHALRQSMVLQEVLGPPAALREEQFRD